MTLLEAIGLGEALTFLLGVNTDFDFDDSFRCGMQRAEGAAALVLQQAMPFDDDALQRRLISASLSKPVGRALGENDAHSESFRALAE